MENNAASKTYEQLLESTKERLLKPTISGVGTPTEQHYDKLFQQFISQVNHIERTLQKNLRIHLDHQEYTQSILIGLTLFIIIIVSLVVRKSLHRQKLAFEKSLAYEKSKLKSDEISRALVEQSPFSIQLMSPNGIIIQVNKAWEKMWASTLENLEGYNILNDVQMAKKGIKGFIERGFSGESIEIPIINYNPEESHGFNAPKNDCFVRSFIYPIKNAQGDIQQVIMLHEDVTESYQQDLFRREQNTILELISNPGTSLSDVLAQLVLFIVSPWGS